MIYVTGDTHGDWSRFEDEILPLAQQWTANDLLLIAGDFGFVFLPPGNAAEEEKLKRLNALPFHIAFCDGNHENFTRLNSYPCERWHGGRVHRLGPRLVHLMRGERYLIQGKTLLVMGGGRSIDRILRVPGLSWWPEEIPTAEELRRFRTLAGALEHADIILTHAAPLSVMSLLRFAPGEEEPLDSTLESVRKSLPHSHWFFGHLHLDRDFTPSLHAMYRTVCRADTGERLRMTSQPS